MARPKKQLTKRQQRNQWRKNPPPKQRQKQNLSNPKDCNRLTQK